MENINFFKQLRERVGTENKETIWENAKLIYEQCYDKKYLKSFRNQQEFAEYLGITKGRISQYRYAYEYFLVYENKLDMKKLSVEQAYYLYRNIGTSLIRFDCWLKEVKSVSVVNLSITDTKKYVSEYLNQRNEVEKKEYIVNKTNINKLTEQEKKIIQFYRDGTDEQRELIDLIIMSE